MHHKEIWRSSLWPGQKVGLVQSQVLSVLLYGAEAGSHTAKDTSRLRVFSNWCARKMKGVRGRPVTLPDPVVLIARRRLKFVLSMIRRPAFKTAKQMPWAEPVTADKRTKGVAARSRTTTYWGVLEQDLALLTGGGNQTAELESALHDSKVTGDLLTVMRKKSSIFTD
jgi:hypothetical protein